jgi:chemotaxis protein histidine kinase CheA
MDVVRSVVEHLGGQLLIESTPGKGTTFVLRLPLTVAIIRVLLVGAGPSDAVYALPLHRVEGALDFSRTSMIQSHGEMMYPVGDELAPLHDLAPMLGYPGPAWPPGGTVVVIEQPFRPLAVRVDRILGQQEVVVKPLGPPLAHVPYLAGAALLADGRPAYILDVAKLTHAAQESLPREEVA